MNIIQFFRILLARRAIILVTLLASLITAIVVSQLLPPRYEARSRVILNTLKADPATGQLIATNMLRNYISTQVQLIKDMQIAGPVIDKLGWANDPALIQSYANATDGRGTDIRRWLAQQIIDSTTVSSVEGSNILEIGYQGSSPEFAKQIADLIRDTFIEQNLRSQRDTAARSADWYRDQADRTLRALAVAENARTAYAKENGIVLDANNVDLESSKLQALSASSAMPTAALAAPISPAKVQLDQIDQQLAQAASTLGPNHPTFQALQRQRAVVAAEVARSGGGISGVSQGQIQSAYAAQKSRVLGERDKIDQLNQMQRDIDIRREQYQKFAESASTLRAQADVGETSLEPLGNATAPTRPSFPNVPLIIMGSVALGAILGVCLALLVELLNRRVRSDTDLEHAADAPVFAIVGNRRNPNGWVSRLIAWYNRRRQSDQLVEA
ncbi:GumC family protein [Sphingomonas flavalba]|uniref:GumC family protein n=1 Tax=Sphingomonas flavalba TaxID=2559804 RepID=UPI00109D903C|nr:Wzz/FepE/Etk N-terminal domain-containing protein [Sphingomonas flavalba]